MTRPLTPLGFPLPRPSGRPLALSFRILPDALLLDIARVIAAEVAGRCDGN
jgi:hypothetical protein